MLIVLLGSVTGFVIGATAFFAHDVPLLTAIGIWIASGPVSALLAVVLSLLPRPSVVSALRREIGRDVDLAETA